MIKHAIYNVYYWIVLGLIKIRYRIKVHGLDTIKVESGKGLLVLANHVAKIDPVILVIALWKKFPVRPLAGEDLFGSSFVRLALSSVDAIAVPQPLGKSRRVFLKESASFLNTVVHELNEGSNMLLYPSGGITKNGKEEIKGKSSAYTIINGSLKCNVILLKSRGLWGSSFSCYPTKKSPALGKTFLKNLLRMMKRFVFFLPKRRVDIFVKEVSYDLLKTFSSKQEFNDFLENFFNDGKNKEKPIEVSY